MPATLSDVARLAGVSQATASRVLNDRRYVSAAARARVESAARQLDYFPNRAARDLSTARTSTVAFLAHHSQYPAGGEGTFGGRVLQGATRALHDAGFDLIYSVLDDQAVRGLARHPSLRASRSAGLMLLGPAIPPEALVELLGTGRPMVLVDNRVDGLAVDAVMADNQPAADALTEHLIRAHSARRLVCLGGPAHWPSTAERVAGCRLAAGRAGVQPTVIHAAETTIRDGAAAAFRLLDDPPDAVVAVTDAMAIGAMHRLAALPRERRPAVVGFDDIAWAQLTDPPLTTVAIDAELMGATAARRLLAAIQAGGELGREPMVERIPGSLRLRASCGCDPQSAAANRM
jgi:DNA-binding LacI/PurR family transcriptional regulator